MSQSALGDGDPFGETAAKMRADVGEHLGEARSTFPNPDNVWKANAGNVLGALNGLHSLLDVGGMAECVRQAKKWYIIDQHVEAFDNPEDLETAIEGLETLIEMVGEAHELIRELTNTMPQLRNAFTDAAETAETVSVDENEDEDEEEG